MQGHTPCVNPAHLWGRRFLWVAFIGLLLLILNRHPGFNQISQAAAPRESVSEAQVSRVGTRLVALSAAGKLPQLFQFSVLPTTKVRNAFIMPGGQVFVTRALLEQLNSEGELAAVLSHEIAHVLIEGANGKAPGLRTAFGNGLPAALDAAPGSLEALEASRQNELEADFLGMCILSQTGYNPADMTKVVQVFLEAAQNERRPPEYLSTHPDPALRLEKIQEHLADLDSCSGGQLPAPNSQ